MEEAKMETERNLGKNGYIYLYDEFEGELSKTLRLFLLDTFSNFANETMNYMRYYDSDLYPFIYNELVLCSVLLPSLKKASNTSIVLTEYPIDREKGSQNKENNIKSGRVDYYIRHKEKDIFLELKFGWISYNSLAKDKTIRKDLLEKLKNAAAQIKDIDWEDAVKIAMIVSPVFVYKSVKSEEEFVKKVKNIDWDNFDKVYEDYFDKFSNEIKEILGKKTQPFLASWDIPKFIDYYWCWDRDNENNGCEAYPTIFFMGTVLK